MNRSNTFTHRKHSYLFILFLTNFTALTKVAGIKLPILAYWPSAFDQAPRRPTSTHIAVMILLIWWAVMTPFREIYKSHQIPQKPCHIISSKSRLANMLHILLKLSMGSCDTIKDYTKRDLDLKSYTVASIYCQGSDRCLSLFPPDGAELVRSCSRHKFNSQWIVDFKTVQILCCIHYPTQCYLVPSGLQLGETSNRMYYIITLYSNALCKATIMAAGWAGGPVSVATTLAYRWSWGSVGWKNRKSCNK